MKPEKTEEFEKHIVTSPVVSQSRVYSNKILSRISADLEQIVLARIIRWWCIQVRLGGFSQTQFLIRAPVLKDRARLLSFTARRAFHPLYFSFFQPFLLSFISSPLMKLISLSPSITFILFPSFPLSGPQYEGPMGTRTLPKSIRLHFYKSGHYDLCFFFFKFSCVMLHILEGGGRVRRL